MRNPSEEDVPTDRIHYINDPTSGLRGAIVIDSLDLGPAMGGCRFWHYSDDEALTVDAIRLAKGMSYKNALAGLPLGGGKAVLRRPLGPFDRTKIFEVFARAVEALGGSYITAEDVGTSVADMTIVRAGTKFVAGLDPQHGKAGGDPSPWTALGVFESMKAAARECLGTELKGLTIAVQGTGAVGAQLSRLLSGAGANLVVADVNEVRAATVAAELDARVVGTDEILTMQADVLAPCALGGVINEYTIPQVKARLICGAANNQLATGTDAEALLDRGIVYAPDYVVNAGGIINAAAEYLGETTGQVEGRIHQIAGRLTAILREAAVTGRPPGAVAEAMAQQIISGATRGERAADDRPGRAVN